MFGRMPHSLPAAATDSPCPRVSRRPVLRVGRFDLNPERTPSLPSTTVKRTTPCSDRCRRLPVDRSRTVGREPLQLEGASCCPLQLGVLRCGVRTKTRAPQTRSCRDRDWRCSRAYGHDSRTSSLARSHEEAVVCTRLDEVGKLLHVDRLQDIAQSLEFSDFRSKLRELGDHRIHPLTERLLDYYRATTPASCRRSSVKPVAGRARPNALPMPS